nr:hypothetical protein Iba_chr11eCG9430 [Ipomoea batatas]
MFIVPKDGVKHFVIPKESEIIKSGVDNLCVSDATAPSARFVVAGRGAVTRTTTVSGEWQVATTGGRFVFHTSVFRHFRIRFFLTSSGGSRPKTVFTCCRRRDSRRCGYACGCGLRVRLWDSAYCCGCGYGCCRFWPMVAAKC